MTSTKNKEKVPLQEKLIEEKKSKWVKDLLTFTAIMVVFVAFFAVIYLVYKGGEEEKEKFFKEIAPKEIKKIGEETQLILEYARDSVAGEKRYVEGRIKNITDTTIDYVYANLEWYDNSGKYFRTITSDAYVDDLAPGKTYTFKIECKNDPMMATFRIDLLTRFAESIPYEASKQLSEESK